MKTKNNIFILICAIFTLGAAYSQNILNNGDFRNSTELKSFYNTKPPANIWSKSQDEDVDAHVIIKDGICNYEIRSAGKHSYSVQLAQGGFTLIPGHSYKLSFDVKAEAERVFGVFLGENGGNWTSFIGRNNYSHNATTEWQNINIEFVVYTKFPYHKLSFELGGINTSISFDNVRLINLGFKEASEEANFLLLKEQIKNPSFRVDSKLDKEFLQYFRKSKFTIYPTIIRFVDTTNWSIPLSKKFAKKLRKHEKLKVHLNREFLFPAKLTGRGQFEFFNNDMEALGVRIKTQNKKSDYYIIPEVLFAPKMHETLFVFGVHIFILNGEGENVFSFLLNSHHELFQESKLFVYKPNTDELNDLILRSLDTGIVAFRLMVD